MGPHQGVQNGQATERSHRLVGSTWNIYVPGESDPGIHGAAEEGPWSILQRELGQRPDTKKVCGRGKSWAGEDSHSISGHSFRIEAATAAAKCGASAQEIKALGRWRSREYQGYVRLDDKVKGVTAASLTKACKKNSVNQ